jgi:CDP-diacylglycerol---glycerol-3-phosphate 3-phosphatidyltransferase
MSLKASEDDPSFKQILWRWRIVCGICILFLACGYAFLRQVWDASSAVRWLFLTTPGIVYLLIVLRRNLLANHRVGELDLLPTFGWGNNLTILRGILLAGLTGFLFSPRPGGSIAWLPGILFTLANAADYLDGFAARVTNRSTRLGEVLDMSLDGAGVLVASILAVQYGQVPVWYLGVAFARYVFLAGQWLRSRLGKPNYELPPSIRRRLFAGLQMDFLAVVLWPLFSPPATTIAAFAFSLPFLVGFLYDWLTVSGVLKPGQAGLGGWFAKISDWLPVGFRILILGLSAGIFIDNLQSFQIFPETYQVIILFELLVLLMIAVGAAGRVAAVLGLVLLGFHQLQAGLSVNQMILIAAYGAVLFLGSGSVSLWRPEEILISRRAGESRAVQLERGC